MKFFDFVLGALLVVAIAFGVAELVATEPYVVQGRVIALEHTPASGATSIGFSNDQPIVVSTQKGEKWALVVDVDGEVNVFDVPPQVYYSVGEGDHIEMTCRKGRLFGVVSCRAAQLRAK